MEDLSIKDAEGHSAKVTSLSTADVDTLNALIGVVNNLSGSATATRNLDELVYSISPLSDAALHLADGDTILSNGIYSRYYAKKLADYNKAPTVANARHIGTLTNNNGVYSGFSITDYPSMDLPFKPDSNTWEINFKITTGSNITSANAIFDGGNSTISVAARIYSSKFQLFLSSNGTSWNLADGSTGSYTLLQNTAYYIKISFSGSTYTLSYSTDGISYTADITINNSTVIYNNTKLVIGVAYGIGSVPADAFSGSIDLNESYIKINGSLWWKGAVKRGFTNEEYFQSMVNTYGSCGKFVLDTTNGTLRLPKLTGFLEGTTSLDALTELTQAGLPDIEGQFNAWSPWGTAGAQGAFSPSLEQPFGINHYTGDGDRASVIKLDASHSSPIYGNSPTVQPQSISVYVYIVLASVIKTDITVDIDNVATDLNTKASKSLDNVTNSANILMAHNAMPSSRYIQLSVPSNGGTYTAPADGYFFLDCVPSGGNWVVIDSNTYRIVRNSAQGLVDCTILFPCVKGTVITVTWEEGVNLMISYHKGFRFYYAEGSKNE